MLGIVLGVLTIVLGLKAFSQKGLPVSKTQNLKGTPGKVIGILCVLLGMGFLVDGGFGTAKLMKMLAKPTQRGVAPAISLPPQVVTQEDSESELESELDPVLGRDVWTRYETFDHVCSAEFPAEPKRTQNKVQSIELRQMLLQRRPGKGFFALNLVAAPQNGPSQSLNDAVANFRSAFGAVEDHAIKQGDVDGWELDFTMAEKISINRIFKWKNTVYRANVVIDQTAKDDPDVKRFFDSIQFNVGPNSAEPAPDATKPTNETPKE